MVAEDGASGKVETSFGPYGTGLDLPPRFVALTMLVCTELHRVKDEAVWIAPNMHDLMSAFRP